MEASILKAIFIKELQGLTVEPVDPDFPNDGISVEFPTGYSMQLRYSSHAFDVLLFADTGQVLNTMETDCPEWAQVIVDRIIREHRT